MKTKILSIVLGMATYLLLLSPAFLPKSVIYIMPPTNGVYAPYMGNITSIGIVIVLAFALHSFVKFWECILNNLKK